MVRATAIAAERIAWSGSEDGRDFAILSGSRANLTLPIREGLPTIQQLSRYKRFRVAFRQNHPFAQKTFRQLD
jgi:hypothetical protein